MFCCRNLAEPADLAESEGQELGAEDRGSYNRVGAGDWINLRVLFSLEKCWIHSMLNGF